MFYMNQLHLTANVTLSDLGEHRMELYIQIGGYPPMVRLGYISQNSSVQAISKHTVDVKFLFLHQASKPS